MIERDRLGKSHLLTVLLMAFILRACVPLIAFITTKDKTVFFTSDTAGYL